MTTESSPPSQAAEQNNTQATDTSSAAGNPTVPSHPTGDPSQTTVNPQSIDRNELLSRARAFLRAPQIQSQDIFAKRKFLIEKGLNEPEIELLLRELPPQLPSIPPRTYPQLPHSGLPTLLLGIARLCGWIMGGSALLLFIYHRFLMPRIIKTSRARHSLKTHQLSLLQKLNNSLRSLKEAQRDTFVSLPSPEPYKEPSEFIGCHTIEQVLQRADEHKLQFHELPQITLLRCGIQEFKSRSEQDSAALPSTEELFRVLESKIPWLVTEEAVAFEQKLWETLFSSEIFVSSESSESGTENLTTTYWDYEPRDPPAPPALAISLQALSSQISRCRRTTTSSPRQNTLQTLTQFTGYISAQVYVPYTSPPSVGNGASNPTVEEELKKEIRALKGMVLNRRSFLPTIPRVLSGGLS